MKRVTLTRVSKGENGTFGVMVYRDQFIATTFELPWKDNQFQISSIPKGLYKVTRYSSAKYKDVFQVMNVPNRDKILIHVGNFQKDTKGCILIGLGFGIDSISESKNALTKLHSTMQNEREWELEIV